MDKNKGTIREFTEKLNVMEIALLNELLSAFGRIHDASTDEVLQYDGDEYIPQALTKAALSIKVGSFTIDTTTATGTQAVTGVGFTPQLVIFFGCQDASDEVSWGFDDGTNKGSIAYQGPTATYIVSTSYSIQDRQEAAKRYDGVINSLDSDGFTISWTRTGTPAGTWTTLYLAIKVA